MNQYTISKGQKLSDIMTEIEPNPYHKLMTTPESFQKVKQAVNNVGIDLYSHFFCLMDESHLLVKDVDYRENIVLPMNDFFLFKQKALVSATPIALSDPRFKAQGFRTVTIDADYDYRQEITVIHSNNSLQSIREYLKEHDTPYASSSIW